MAEKKKVAVKDIVRYVLAAAAVIAGSVFSLRVMPELLLIYLFFGAFCIFTLRLDGEKTVPLDLIFAPVVCFFTVYFVNLITSIGHEFVSEEPSMAKWIFEADNDRIKLDFFIALGIYLTLRFFFVPAKWAAALAPLPQFLLSLTEYYVYHLRGSEFLPSDITGAGTAFSVLSNYRPPVAEPMFCLIIPYALYVCAFLRLKVRPEIKKPVVKLIAARAVMLVFLGISAYQIRDMISMLRQRSTIMMWGDEGVSVNGFTNNFVLALCNMRMETPPGYDRIYEETLVASDLSVTEEPSNIIIILSESYSDLSVHKDYTFNGDPDPYWDSLTENTYHGYTYCSVFGGRTPNSEFEVLTSLPSGNLPNGAIPYSMYLDSPHRALPQFLRDIGYTTIAMHPFLASGWNRTTVYPNIGFDEMYFQDDFEYNDDDLIREYVSDRAAYRNMLERLESTGGPKFMFLITMQNHGGYDEMYDNLEYINYLDGNGHTNIYMSLVHQSDLALEYLIDELSSSDERYTLLIFGDHQPTLPLQISHDLGAPAMVTPYIIWTNYDMPEDLYNRQFEDGYNYTSLNYLALDVLEAAGIGYSDYYNEIASIREELPAVSAGGCYSAHDGRWEEFRSLTDPSDTGAWDAYRCLQYYYLFDN